MPGKLENLSSTSDWPSIAFLTILTFLTMTTRCLAVTGGDSFGKCVQLAFSAHYNIFILTYWHVYSLSANFTCVWPCCTQSQQSLCMIHMQRRMYVTHSLNSNDLRAELCLFHRLLSGSTVTADATVSSVIAHMKGHPQLIRDTLRKFIAHLRLHIACNSVGPERLYSTVFETA